jgi:hypothetical protein
VNAVEAAQNDAAVLAAHELGTKLVDSCADDIRDGRVAG